MNRMIAVCIIMSFVVVANAQTRRSLKDIDRELKQTKSTATAMELIESIADTPPQTDEEVAVLGQLMDKYPAQGQKALAGIGNPKLAKAVMKECDRQVAKFKSDKDKDWKTLPETQRRDRFNALLNTHATIAALGNLKNKEALPFLKQYITKEYDGILSYQASQAIGRIAPDDPAVFKELWDKPGMKNISYNAYGKSVLKEVAQKMQDPNVPENEKHNVLVKSKVSLLSGRDPEEKRLLKDIVLNHPNEDLRKEAGIAMLHALRNNPDAGDIEFVLRWTKDVKAPSTGWAIYYIRDHFDARFVPVLMNYLVNGVYASDRAGAVEALWKNNVKEALPYFETCIEKDRDSTVRGRCRDNYYRITGKIPVVFHPDDVKDIEGLLVDSSSIKYRSSLKENDPHIVYINALVSALNEYKRTHPTVGGK